jgi:hypothetical protein
MKWAGKETTFNYRDAYGERRLCTIPTEYSRHLKFRATDR